LRKLPASLAYASLTQASASGTEHLNIDEHYHAPEAELWAGQWVFSSFKKTLDSSGIKSIIRIFLRYPTEGQEVIMTSKANHFITADLVNIHTPVT
jgi:hypothetical protein